MKTPSRIFLLLSGVLALSYYLPAAYWLVAAKRERAPIVFYSSVEKRFLFTRFDGEGLRHTDTSDKTYEREEFERLLPLGNWAQLTKDGRMPRQIDGVALTIESVRRAQFSVRVDPASADSPQVGLFPLLESESGRARLELPPDFVRLGDGVEFLDPRENRVLEAKSARYAKAFAEAGFVFPVRAAANNPTNRKPYDEGAYLVDASGAVFRLRQVGGAPELGRVADLAAEERRAAWRELKPRFIQVQEVESRELRGLFLGEDGKLRLAVGSDFRLIEVPLRNYEFSRTKLSLRGNLLYRLLVAETEEGLQALVFDREYRLVDRYEEALPSRGESPTGRLATALFPFSWSLQDAGSAYLGFRLETGAPWALALNGILFAGWLLWRRLKKRAGVSVLDAVVVATTGIFGLIAVLLAPSAD